MSVTQQPTFLESSMYSRVTLSLPLQKRLSLSQGHGILVVSGNVESGRQGNLSAIRRPSDSWRDVGGDKQLANVDQSLLAKIFDLMLMSKNVSVTWVKQGSALILIEAFLSFIFTWDRRLLEDDCRRPKGSSYQAQDRKCKS